MRYNINHLTGRKVGKHQLGAVIREDILPTSMKLFFGLITRQYGIHIQSIHHNRYYLFLTIRFATTYPHYCGFNVGLVFKFFLEICEKENTYDDYKLFCNFFKMSHSIVYRTQTLKIRRRTSWQKLCCSNTPNFANSFHYLQ